MLAAKTEQTPLLPRHPSLLCRPITMMSNHLPLSLKANEIGTEWTQCTELQRRKLRVLPIPMNFTKVENLKEFELLKDNNSIFLFQNKKKKEIKSREKLFII